MKKYRIVCIGVMLLSFGMSLLSFDRDSDNLSDLAEQFQESFEKPDATSNADSVELPVSPKIVYHRAAQSPVENRGRIEKITQEVDSQLIERQILLRKVNRLKQTSTLKTEFEAVESDSEKYLRIKSKPWQDYIASLRSEDQVVDSLAAESESTIDEYYNLYMTFMDSKRGFEALREGTVLHADNAIALFDYLLGDYAPEGAEQYREDFINARDYALLRKEMAQNLSYDPDVDRIEETILEENLSQSRPLSEFTGAEYDKAQNIFSEIDDSIYEFQQAMIAEDFQRAMGFRRKVNNARTIAAEIGLDISGLESRFAILDDPILTEYIQESNRVMNPYIPETENLKKSSNEPTIPYPAASASVVNAEPSPQPEKTEVYAAPVPRYTPMVHKALEENDIDVSIEDSSSVIELFEQIDGVIDGFKYAIERDDSIFAATLQTELVRLMEETDALGLNTNTFQSDIEIILEASLPELADAQTDAEEVPSSADFPMTDEQTKQDNNQGGPSRVIFSPDNVAMLEEAGVIYDIEGDEIIILEGGFPSKSEDPMVLVNPPDEKGVENHPSADTLQKVVEPFRGELDDEQEQTNNSIFYERSRVLGLIPQEMTKEDFDELYPAGLTIVQETTENRFLPDDPEQSAQNFVSPENPLRIDIADPEMDILLSDDSLDEEGRQVILAAINHVNMLAIAPLDDRQKELHKEKLIELLEQLKDLDLSPIKADIDFVLGSEENPEGQPDIKARDDVVQQYDNSEPEQKSIDAEDQLQKVNLPTREQELEDIRQTIDELLNRLDSGDYDDGLYILNELERLVSILEESGQPQELYRNRINSMALRISEMTTIKDTVRAFPRFEGDPDESHWTDEELTSWLNDPNNIVYSEVQESWLNRTGMYSCFHPNRWSEKGVYYPYAPTDEIFENRTRHSKTFRNEDGSFTAVMLADLHYQDDEGNLRDVDLSLERNSTARHPEYELVNLKNHFKTFIDTDGDEGVIYEINGQEIRFGTGRKIELKRTDASETIISEPSEWTVVDRRKVELGEVFPDIREEIVMLKGGIEHGYWLDSDEWFSGSDSLVFVEQVDISGGWKVMSDGQIHTEDFSTKEFKVVLDDTENGIGYRPVKIYDGSYDYDNIIKTAEIRQYDGEVDTSKTISSDSLDSAILEVPYDVKFDGNTLLISYKIPVSWLEQPERTYPIYIDPTVDVLAGYSLSSQTNSGMPYNTYYHDQRYDFLLTASDMIAAGITAGSTITGMSMYCSSSGSLNLSNFRIRTYPTYSTTITSWRTSGWTTNYGPTTQGTPSSGVWYTYSFSTNYSFNGSANMEWNVSRDNSSWSGSGGNYCRGTFSSRAGYGYSDSGYSWPYDGMSRTSFSYLPAMRLTYTAGVSHPCVPPLSVTSYPYTQNFESSPGSEWCTSSENSNGRVERVLRNGSYCYYMDVISSGTYSENACVLRLNLSGQTGNDIDLTYELSCNGDEVHTQDRLQMSTNGGSTWTTIDDYSTTCSSTWGVRSIDLDSQSGFSYSSNFLLKWTQYDNYAYSTDGRGIDDISITSTPSCQSSYPYSTTLNSIPTGWTNGASGNRAWIFSSDCDGNGTPSSSTGPSCYHSASGFYFTEASGIYNATYAMDTKCLDLTVISNPVLKFWYHMYGGTMGSLYIDVSTNGGSTWTTGVWSRTGQQHSSYTAAWTQASVDLSSYRTNNVVIRFRGVTGTSYTSDMAIDDVTIENCPTPSIPTDGSHSSTTSTITWRWNSASGATGYYWNTTSDLGSAIDRGSNLYYTESGLPCGSLQSSYVWAYNSCGTSSYQYLSASTSACGTPGLWTGNVSTSWFTAGNWDDNTVPTSSVDVEIPSGRPRYPNLSSGTAYCRNIDIESGASMTISGGYLYVNGTTGDASGYNGMDILGTFTISSGTLDVARSIELWGGIANFNGGFVDTDEYLYNRDGYTNNMYIRGGTVQCQNIPNYQGNIYHSGGTIDDYGYYREQDTGGGNYYGSGSATINFRGSSYIRLRRSGSYFNDVNVYGTYYLISDTSYDWYINGDLYVSGTLDLNDNMSRYVHCQGNWNSSSGTVYPPNHIYFEGSTNAYINTGGQEHFVYLDISKSSSSYGMILNGNVRCEHLILNEGYYNINGYTHTSDGVMYAYSGSQLRMSSGTMNVNGSASGYSSASFYVASGATENVSGGTIFIRGYGSGNDCMDIDGNFTPTGGTVEIQGSLDPVYIDGSGTLSFYNLTIDRTGEEDDVQLQRTLDINNDLLIDSGTLHASGYAINIAGDWTNNSNFTHGNNTVTFDGSGTSVITGGGGGGASVNIAPSATESHSGGGTEGTGYGPSNYNDGVIPSYGNTPWGWTSTGGWIEFVWPTNQTFNSVKFYKDNRPMSTCTFQYWNGSSYVNFYTYNSSTIEHQVTFSSVTSTRLRFYNIGGSSNPNFREIEIFSTGSSAGETFYDLTCLTPNKQLNFGAGQMFTIDDDFTMSGGSTATRVRLRSTSTGTQWYLNVGTGDDFVQYVDVQDSDANSGTEIDATIGSNDSGNNENWRFGCVAPVINVTGGTGCNSVTMSASISSHGYPTFYDYAWYAGTGCTGTVLSTSSTYTATSTGYYSCKVSPSGYGGLCSDCDYAYATVHTPPTTPTGITGTTTISSGSSTSLTATGGSTGSGCTYQWYAGGCGSGSVLGTSATLNTGPLYETTTFYVRRVGNTTCTNTTGCRSVTVTVQCSCPGTVSSFPYSEGFESGMGYWANRGGDDFDWSRHSGTTSSGGTGPSGAHGGSYYIYTEASSPNYPSKTATIYGPCFNFSSLEDPEIEFWYHMFGANIGTIYLEASNDNCQTWSTRWSRTGQQHTSETDPWDYAVVDLSAYEGDSQVQLRWRGVTGTSYAGDICIDDIRVQRNCTTPGTPTALSGTATGFNTASLNWSAGFPTGSSTVTYYWSVGESPTHTYSSGYTARGTTTGTSATATGLDEETTYYLRVYARTDCDGTTSGTATSADFQTEWCKDAPLYDYNIYPGSTFSTHGPITINENGCRIYRVYMTAYREYKFTVCSDGGSYSDDTVFELFDDSGTSILYVDDACGLGSEMTYLPTTTGYRYLKIRGYAYDNETYTLAYGTIPGSCTSCSGYDNYLGTPTTTYNTHSSTITAGGCHMYRFYLYGGTEYKFTFCDGGGDADFDTYLYLDNSSCTQVASNDDHCGLQSEIVYSAPSTGYYYLEVNSYSSNSGGPFTLAYRQNLPWCTCSGAVDHGGLDETISAGTEICGRHYNIGNLTINSTYVPNQSGCANHGWVQIEADNITQNGIIDADGAGSTGGNGGNGGDCGSSNCEGSLGGGRAGAGGSGSGGGYNGSNGGAGDWDWCNPLWDDDHYQAGGGSGGGGGGASYGGWAGFGGGDSGGDGQTGWGWGSGEWDWFDDFWGWLSGNCDPGNVPGGYAGDGGSRGSTYGSSTAHSIEMGSGGGGGGGSGGNYVYSEGQSAGGDGYSGGDGGRGGGSVTLIANGTLDINSDIDCDGDPGGYGATGRPADYDENGTWGENDVYCGASGGSGGGGGGSGGGIMLQGAVIDISNSSDLFARGGSGGSGSRDGNKLSSWPYYYYGDGGTGGGGGRIKFFCTSCNGITHNGTNHLDGGSGGYGSGGGYTPQSYSESGGSGTFHQENGYGGVAGYWTGAVSNDWMNGLNWSNCSVPSAATNVVIPSGCPNWPELGTCADGYHMCNNLTIQNGATVTSTTNNNSHYIDGNFYINGGGTFQHTNGRMWISGIVDVDGVWNPSGGYVVAYDDWNSSGGQYRQTGGTTYFYQASGTQYVTLGSSNYFNQLRIGSGGTTNTVQMGDSWEIRSDLHVRTSARLYTLSYNLDVANYIEIDGHLDCGTYSPTIYLGTNWDNSAGTFTSGSSRVIFDGSSNSNIYSGGDPFYHLRLSKTAESDIVLPVSYDVDINGQLEIYSGTYRDNARTTDVAGHLYVDGSNAKLEVTAGGEIHIDAESNMYLYTSGVVTLSNGWLRLNNAMVVGYGSEGVGYLNVSGTGNLWIDEQFYIGGSSGAGINLNMSGGTINVGYYLNLDNYTAWNITGGTWIWASGEGSYTYIDGILPSGIYFWDIEIASGREFRSMGNDLEIRGDWTNYGTFTHGNNEVVFTGSTNSLITGGAGGGLTHTFTNCGQTGRTGPSLAQANSEYAGTSLEGEVSVTNGIQYWTVPSGVTELTIEAYGAEGGGSYGGEGARMRGTFSVSPGEVLKVLVGQMGVSSSRLTSGGGASYVTRADNTPLVVAGGGGGADASGTNQDGWTSSNGQNGYAPSYSAASGGTGGNGGNSTSGTGHGGGGGGFYSNASGSSYGYGFISGGYGGLGTGADARINGGFGGGGGSADNYTGSGYWGGGAGGGYSGGGAACASGTGAIHRAGGGGSYNAGTDQSNSTGANSGHGRVLITIPSTMETFYDLTVDKSGTAAIELGSDIEVLHDLDTRTGGPAGGGINTIIGIGTYSITLPNGP